MLSLGQADFDYQFSGDWTYSDELNRKLDAYFNQVMSSYGISVPETSVERINAVGLARNSSCFTSRGNDYTGQWYIYNPTGRNTFVGLYIQKNEIAKLLNELNNAARLKAMSRVAEELGWLKIDDETSDINLLSSDGYAPGSDRIVTFDHNDPQTKSVLSLAEQADEIIRGSNSLDEEQRGWIREHIRAGIDFIKNHKKMLAGAASALLLKPLLAAYEAVAEEPAKAAILAAIEAVKSMFGI